MASRNPGDSSVLRAVRALLRPIVRVCLRSGISTGEVRALLEHAFVHEAAAYLLQRGERASLVNLSAITGISRQAVRVLLGTPDNDVAPRSDTQLHRAVRVLRGWHEDPDFLDAKSSAIELPIIGAFPSFERLVRRYGGGVTYQSVLERLLANGAVELIRSDQSAAHRVRAVRTDLRQENGAPAALAQATTICADALYSVADMTPGMPDAGLPPRILAVTVPASSASVVRARLGRRSEVLMTSVEDALSDLAMTPADVDACKALSPHGTVDVRISLLVTMDPDAVARDRRK